MTTPTRSNARFDARLTLEQKRLFEQAAAVGGFRNLTDFILRAVQEKAEELIAENERIIASKRDSEVFFRAITGAKKPNKRLADAAQAYRDYVTG